MSCLVIFAGIPNLGTALSGAFTEIWSVSTLFTTKVAPTTQSPTQLHVYYKIFMSSRYKIKFTRNKSNVLSALVGPHSGGRTRTRFSRCEASLAALAYPVTLGTSNQHGIHSKPVHWVNQSRIAYVSRMRYKPTKWDFDRVPGANLYVVARRRGLMVTHSYCKFWIRSFSFEFCTRRTI